MDEVTLYIFRNYFHLMAVREAAAYESLLGEKKAERVKSLDMQPVLKKQSISADRELRVLLADGDERFMVSVRDRILRQHAAQVV